MLGVVLGSLCFCFVLFTAVLLFYHSFRFGVAPCFSSWFGYLFVCFDYCLDCVLYVDEVPVGCCVLVCVVYDLCDFVFDLWDYYVFFVVVLCF